MTVLNLNTFFGRSSCIEWMFGHCRGSHLCYFFPIMFHNRYPIFLEFSLMTRTVLLYTTDVIIQCWNTLSRSSSYYRDLVLTMIVPYIWSSPHALTKLAIYNSPSIRHSFFPNLKIVGQDIQIFIEKKHVKGQFTVWCFRIPPRTLTPDLENSSKYN